MGAAGGELGGGGVAGAGQNGHPGSFNSGFGTESERTTSRTRRRALRDAQRQRSARATAAGRSKAPASKIRAEQSEREGEKGSASVLSTSRSSWAVNLSRRSSGVAARRETELRAHQWRRLGFARTGAAAAVRWGSKGFQGGAGALNRGGDRALACGPRRKERRGACGGRSPGVRVAHAGEMTPTGGARLSAAERGRGRRSGPRVRKWAAALALGPRGEKEKGRGKRKMGVGWAERR